MGKDVAFEGGYLNNRNKVPPIWTSGRLCHGREEEGKH